MGVSVFAPFMEAWDGAYKALRSMVVDQRAGGARLDVGEALS
jgi:hypothetical protein